MPLLSEMEKRFRELHSGLAVWCLRAGSPSGCDAADQADDRTFSGRECRDFVRLY